MAMHLNKDRKKIVWLSTLAALLIVGGIAAYLSFKPHSKAPLVTTASQVTKGPSTEIPPTTSKSGNSATKGSTSDTSNSPATKNTNPPDQPTGIFVSNHRPRLSSENLANQINSACTTTSGASCTISFTKDNQTISLVAQEADRGGSTYWTWKLQDYGITEGTWRVKATATLNGKSVSADDSVDLVVAP